MKEMKLVIHMERTMDEKMTILLQAKNLRLYLLLIKTSISTLKQTWIVSNSYNCYKNTTIATQ